MIALSISQITKLEKFDEYVVEMEGRYSTHFHGA